MGICRLCSTAGGHKRVADAIGGVGAVGGQGGRRGWQGWRSGHHTGPCRLGRACDDRRVRFPTTKPYTVSECATFMGASSEYIRLAISDGVPLDHAIVKLVADKLPGPGRPYRIYEPDFLDFLRAIGWKHLPTSTPLAAPSC